MLRRRRRKVLIALMVVYLAVILLGGWGDYFILHPSRNRIDAQGAQESDFTRANGATVESWIARSPGTVGREPEVFELDFTGNGTRAEQIATYIAGRWKQHPVEVWVVNYPGYGGSTGPASLAAIPGTAVDAFDRLAKVAHGRPIIAAGHSLGTSAALYVAAHRPVAGMILQNPPALRQLLLGEYGWWNLWLLAAPVAWQLPSGLDSVTNAAHCTAPAVLISGIHDTFVPPKYHNLVFNAYAGPNRRITFNGGHNTPADKAPEFFGDLDWLWTEVTCTHAQP